MDENGGENSEFCREMATWHASCKGYSVLQKDVCVIVTPNVQVFRAIPTGWPLFYVFLG